MLSLSKRYAYRWHGVDQHGHTIHGKSTAMNTQELHQTLIKQSIYPLAIQRDKPNTMLSRIHLSLKQWITLLDQWQYGLKSHLSINQTLEILQDQVTDDKLRIINHYCYQQTQQGLTLSQALSDFEHLNPAWIIHTIKAGEQQGDLCHVLSHCQNCLQQQLQLQQHIKKALMYPCLVISLTVLITLFMVLVIIPQFQDLYQQLNTELPWMTQLLLNLSGWLRQHFYASCACLLGIGACLLLLNYYYPNTKIILQNILLHIPSIRGFIQHQQLARWYGIFALLNTAGITIDASLQTCNACFSHFAFKQFGDGLLQSVLQGCLIQTICLSSPLLPPLDKQLLAIGENTGQLSQVCQRLSDHHQQCILRWTEQVGQWLEPSIMILLAVIIGGLVMAMYAPIFNLGNIL